MILRRVNLEKLEYLGENETKFVNISTHYSVPARQTRIMKKTVRKSCVTVPLKRILKSHLTSRSIILRGTSVKYEYLGENETKNENILTH